ncbi:Mediator complex subunit 13 C-terminal domain-containing protein [Elsinoe fawcettii]|nr:Mediator complex subunit 13 C-terminal domain-containing protein [Elsinoe fawcettii]
MEFLRSCTSNAHLLHNESTLDIKYDCFELHPTTKAGDRPTHINGTLRVLRSLGQIAAIDHQNSSRLWTFHPKGRDDEAPELAGLTHVSTGSIASSELIDAIRQSKAEPPRDYALLFFEAFSAYVTQVLRSIGTVHFLGHMSWLLTPLHDDVIGVKGNSDVSTHQSLVVTTTFRAISSGTALVCATDVRTSGLLPLVGEGDAVKFGQATIMAPTGITGIVQEYREQLHDSKAADDAWLWLIEQYPFLEQFDKTGANQAWVTVKLKSTILKDSSIEDSRSHTPVYLTWPTSLCYTYTNGLSEEECLTFLDTDDLTEIRDPIEQAEQWLFGTADREKALKAAESSTANGNLEAQVDSMDDDLDLTASPIYNRNLDTVASNGVYPTPPDGIAPVHNPATVSSVNAAETTHEDEQPRRPSADRISQKQSIDLDIGDLDDDNEDNLFGDIDEDMFGNQDIDVTDADFNFFDVGAARGVSRQISPEKHLTTSMADIGNPEHQKQYSAQHLREVMDAKNSQRNAQDFNTNVQMQDVQVPDIILHEEEHSSIRDPSDDVNHRRIVATSTPPLSPVLVKKQLFTPDKSDQTDHAMANHPEDSRAFAPVSFKALLASNSAKYKNGGRFADDLNSRRTDLTPQSIKRNISLRDYLEKSGRLQEDKPRLTITSAGLRSLRLEETDDSDTDSVLSADGYIHPASKRVAIEPNSAANESKRVNNSDGRKDSNGTTIDVSGLELGLSRSRKTIANRPTHTDAWCFLAGWTKSLSMTCLESKENLWEIFDFEGPDYIAVAQLLAEDALSHWNLPSHYHEKVAVDSAVVFARNRCITSTTSMSSTKALSLHNLTSLSVNAIVANADQAQKNGPRPTARRIGNISGGVSYGQQLFPLSAPFVRLRRGESTWDLLSSALNFWEALGLEPTHGMKNVSAELITIGSDDLRDICVQLVQDVQYFYETCKFGSHGFGYRMHRKVREASDSPGTVTSREDLILSTLKDACIDLAKKINHRQRLDGRKPVVVYLVNPFKDEAMTKFVCACFQSCFRELAPNAREATLQIIPYNIIAQAGGAVIPRARQLIRLCMSIYDKIRPQRPEATQTPWKLFCASSVTLVSPLPRKINFALNETPPINLMQEAQVLHVAYAISSDARWLSVAWTDYTGNHQMQRSYCLYRADREAVFAAVKDTTAALITSTATWRVIIACAGHSAPQERKIFSSLNAPTVALVMVDVCLTPLIQIFPQSTDTDPLPAVPTTPALGQAASSLTPTSTPQAASTVSPDSHHPPTPSSADHMSHATAQALESSAPDPDAHLVDTRDESFALVLPFSTTQSPHGPGSLGPQKKVLASGQLLKRGDAVPNMPLPSLGVDVMEVLPPKIQQGQSSWMLPRTPEYVLREVLAWYRGLGLLGKIRGVKGCEMGERPWHIGVVVCASEALVGFFD